MVRDLRAHLALAEEILGMVTHEGEALREEAEFSPTQFHAQRKNLLARLDISLNALRAHRMRWQRASAEERAGYGEISSLLRANQEMIMRIVVRDRENEQALLRRGFVPPRHLPPVQRQQPHFVADLYRRHQI